MTDDVAVNNREWSHPVSVDTVARKPKRMTLEANTAERAAVAHRLGLLGVDRLTAGVSVRRSGQRGTARLFHVTGRFAAAVEQTCVFTGDPVTAVVVAELDARFADDPAIFDPASASSRAVQPSARGEVFIDVEAEDPPEPLTAGAIDLGELVVQELSVVLDPYPRAPSADTADLPVLTEAATMEQDKAVRPNPFAKLAALTPGIVKPDGG